MCKLVLKSGIDISQYKNDPIYYNFLKELGFKEGEDIGKAVGEFIHQNYGDEIEYVEVDSNKEKQIQEIFKKSI